MTEVLEHVNGTLIWYYCICPREAWLMARQITPDEDDPNIVIGRFLHEQRYAREKKEILVDAGKMDVVKLTDEGVVVREVKKSSRYLESSRMQLLYYLKLMREHGIEARGELLFPEERKKEEVFLTAENLQKLEQTEAAILRLVNQPAPPPPKKISFCRQCAYREYCWA
ncbi:MAG: CRISPR-associated protein Cas4 [Bacillus thermozeamaize]|uniref:CRISPR-associated exonuclease Cas4 n=1 Tax=Bacillus thermozeamaize TaxID=230954 RepID=A0A1Y3PV47_9BACI|nr:MAG: CRISPR-associated protein Cas4 [Bacillus thermozeamaize]